MPELAFLGVLRRENKPSVLPEDKENAELQKDGSLQVSRKE